APDRDGSHALVTMRHQVWRDHFQGTALAKALARQDHRADALLAGNDLPEGVLRSTGLNLSEETWSRLFVTARDNGRKSVRNLLRMHLLRHDDAERLPLPPVLAACLSGTD